MTYTVGFDTEFFNSNNPKMDIVCAVLCFPDRTEKYWLLDNKDLARLHKDLLQIKLDKATILAYAAIAEGRSLLSLGLDPFEYNWIDLYVEFRMLCNSNNKYNYGPYIGDDGSKKYSIPPDPYMDDEDKKISKKAGTDFSETPKNFINAAYKLLNVIVDTEQKTDMRDLILSKNKETITERRDEILDYCFSDTKYLRALDLAIQKAYREEGLDDFRRDQISRGEYAIAIAKTEELGMPLDINLLNKIVEKTPEILERYKIKVNEHFPFFLENEIGKTVKLKNGKVKKFKDTEAKKDLTAYKKFVESLNIPNFPTTDKGKIKYDKQTLIDYRTHHPALRELLLYTEIETNLKWFNKGSKSGFFERVGEDNHIRPYFGIFGTQTGRNAAKATTFPLAMSSWLRSIIRPKLGQYIIGADFSQQEVYVGAVLSGDSNLRNAYDSGDTHLFFAKLANAVPKDAIKKGNEVIREKFKSTNLGIQYGMGVNKLRIKISKDTKQETSLEEAAELKQYHTESFSDFWAHTYAFSAEYKAGTPLATNDGFVMFCDNPRITSVRNYPVQGNSASITRLAVVNCWKAGLKVICSLHDAVYLLTDTPEKDELLLRKIMIEATATILNEPVEKCTMRIDTKIISGDKYWIDPKGQQDWDDLKTILLS